MSLSSYFWTWLSWKCFRIKTKLDKKFSAEAPFSSSSSSLSKGSPRPAATSHLARQLCAARWFDFAATFPLEDLMQTHGPSWKPLGPRPSRLGLKHNTSSISWYWRPPTDRTLAGNQKGNFHLAPEKTLTVSITIGLWWIYGWLFCNFWGVSTCNFECFIQISPNRALLATYNLH